MRVVCGRFFCYKWPLDPAICDRHNYEDELTNYELAQEAAP